MDVNLAMVTKAYACYSNIVTSRSKSSSGGIYPLLASSIICEEGIVFAACYDDELNVFHRKIDTLEDICLSQGSKYVSSTLGKTFQYIKEASEKGKNVLFVGTPCQCAGLLSFIEMKKLNKEKIVVIDCVCHGVPGKVSWEAYKNSLAKKGFMLSKVNMRDKSTGWTKGNYSWSLTDKNGCVIAMHKNKNSFMKGMLANLTIRPSCFSCRFKGVERKTDITIGDYWGIWNHLPEMDDNKGTSLVLIHTEQGLELFNRIRDKITMAEAVIDKAVKGNVCIVESTTYNPKREEFFTRLHNGEDFILIIEDLTSLGVKEKIKIKIKSLLKAIIKRT